MSSKERWIYWIFVGAIAVAFIRFAQYWLSFDRRPVNFSGDGLPTVFDIALFVTLSIVILLPVFMMTLGFVITGLLQRPGKMRAPVELPDPATTRVAFITTYVPGSEPLDMLSKTLTTMRDVDYPHDTWVLDEGDDNDVRTLCEIIGVHYFSRKGIARYNEIGSKFSPKSKGGNHNAWYDAHGAQMYDIVAQIDTDFIPRNDFLTKTLPYFLDPEVAWVGTPQVYGNMDNFVARGAAEQTYGFYGPILKGLAKIDSTMLIGANHVIRVAALKEVGLYNPHLTEDLATGILLHSHGWKSTYVQEALAIGEGPDTWSTFFKQQFRWAKGCNDLLFTRTFSAIRGMKPLQGLLYSWIQMYYLIGAAYGLGLVLMGLYFGFGWEAAKLEVLPFLMAYIPILVVFEVAFLWAQRFNIRPKVERGLYLRGRILMVAVMPVFLAAFISAIKDRNKHTEFEVTPKGGVTTVVTVKKVKKGKNPYKAHLSIVVYTGIILFVGIMSGRTEWSYIGWALVVFSSTFAIAIRPTWPRILQFGNKQLAEFKHQLEDEFYEQLGAIRRPFKGSLSETAYLDHSVLARSELKTELEFMQLIRTSKSST